MNPYDVVVVGGGPAGAAAARAAVVSGARVLLVERDLRPRDKICGEYLCPGAVARLRTLGLAHALRDAHTAPLPGMRLFSPAGREVMTRFPAGSPGLSVRRSDFDPRLVALSGASVLRGARLERLAADADGVHLHLATGEEVVASVVVGADGRHSTVAAQAGLRAAPKGRARATLHAYYEGVAGSVRAGEMHLPGTGSYAGLNPGPDGLVNVTYVCDLEELGPAPKANAGELLDAALANIPSLAQRFAHARRAGDTSILAPLAVRTRRVGTDRVLLSGDAAGFLDPLTGEGMYGAIVSGELAGRHAAAIALEGASADAYPRAYRAAFGGKPRLNRLFQWLLRRPALLEALGARFTVRPHLGDTLMAVIGNLEPPAELLRPRMLLGLLA